MVSTMDTRYLKTAMGPAAKKEFGKWLYELRTISESIPDQAHRLLFDAKIRGVPPKDKLLTGNFEVNDLKGMVSKALDAMNTYSRHKPIAGSDPAVFKSIKDKMLAHIYKLSELGQSNLEINNALPSPVRTLAEKDDETLGSAQSRLTELENRKLQLLEILKTNRERVNRGEDPLPLSSTSTFKLDLPEEVQQQPPLGPEELVRLKERFKEISDIIYRKPDRMVKNDLGGLDNQIKILRELSSKSTDADKAENYKFRADALAEQKKRLMEERNRILSLIHSSSLNKALNVSSNPPQESRPVAPASPGASEPASRAPAIKSTPAISPPEEASAAPPLETQEPEAGPQHLQLPGTSTDEPKAWEAVYDEMADANAAANATDQVLSLLRDNPVYANTYGPLFETLRANIGQNVPNMYKMVPKIKDAANYMSKTHPRLYYRAKGHLVTIVDSIVPPRKTPQPKGIVQKVKDLFSGNVMQNIEDAVRNFAEKPEPNPWDEVERQFHAARNAAAGHAGYTVHEIASAVESYIDKMKKAGYDDTDVKMAVLRKYGAAIFNAVYDNPIVETSGKGVDLSTLEACEWKSAATRILGSDQNGIINVRVMLGGTARTCAVISDL